MDDDMTYECRFYLNARAEYKLYRNICDQLDPKSPVRRNEYELKNYCYYGFVNEDLRASYWKLFMNYFPENKFKTEHFLKERRNCYKFYCDNSNEIEEPPTVNEPSKRNGPSKGNESSKSNESSKDNEPSKSNESTTIFISEPSKSNESKKEKELVTSNESTTINEPNESKESKTILIDKLKESNESTKNNESKKINESKKVLINDMERINLFPIHEEGKVKCEFLDAPYRNGTNRDAIKRILICFSVTNSSIGYVQGMNMLVIPIYYVFANSKNEEDRLYAEEDTYFCFYHLMTEIGEHFVRDLDYDENLGIRRKMDRVFEIISRHSNDLYENLKEKGIIDTTFHLRWVLLLLAHEFQIDQVVLLWDKFLADKNRFEMVEYCCASIILLMKNPLLGADFDTAMKLLQRPLDDALTIFFYADKLRRDDVALRNDDNKG